MMFWGYLAQPDGEAELRAAVEQRGGFIKQVFAEKNATSKNALTDLLVANRSCPVVIVSPEELLEILLQTGPTSSLKTGPPWEK